MPRSTAHPKEQSFNFRVDPKLKSDFQSATEAEDKPAAQVLRDFMRAYVERRAAAEARRQSRLVAERSADASSDEAEGMRWIGDVSETDGRTA